MTQYDEWRFYAKDGTTLRATVQACLREIPYEGVVSKTFSWMLKGKEDFDKLISLCRFAEGAYCSRTPQRGSFIYRDKSPGQTNTVRIVDPSGGETGYYILSDCAPIRDIALGGHYDFEISALWLGTMKPPEPLPGLYRIFLGLLPGQALYPSATLKPGSG